MCAIIFISLLFPILGVLAGKFEFAAGTYTPSQEQVIRNQILHITRNAQTMTDMLNERTAEGKWEPPPEQLAAYKAVFRPQNLEDGHVRDPKEFEDVWSVWDQVERWEEVSNVEMTFYGNAKHQLQERNGQWSEPFIDQRTGKVYTKSLEPLGLTEAERQDSFYTIRGPKGVDSQGVSYDLSHIVHHVGGRTWLADKRYGKQENRDPRTVEEKGFRSRWDGDIDDVKGLHYDILETMLIHIPQVKGPGGQMETLSSHIPGSNVQLDTFGDLAKFDGMTSEQRRGYLTAQLLLSHWNLYKTMLLSKVQDKPIIWLWGRIDPKTYRALGRTISQEQEPQLQPQRSQPQQRPGPDQERERQRPQREARPHQQRPHPEELSSDEPPQLGERPQRQRPQQEQDPQQARPQREEPSRPRPNRPEPRPAIPAGPAPNPPKRYQYDSRERVWFDPNNPSVRFEAETIEGSRLLLRPRTGERFDPLIGNLIESHAASGRTYPRDTVTQRPYDERSGLEFDNQQWQLPERRASANVRRPAADDRRNIRDDRPSTNDRPAPASRPAPRPVDDGNSRPASRPSRSRPAPGATLVSETLRIGDREYERDLPSGLYRDVATGTWYNQQKREWWNGERWTRRECRRAESGGGCGSGQMPDLKSQEPPPPTKKQVEEAEKVRVRLYGKTALKGVAGTGNGDEKERQSSVDRTPEGVPKIGNGPEGLPKSPTTPHGVPKLGVGKPVPRPPSMRGPAVVVPPVRVHSRKMLRFMA